MRFFYLYKIINKINGKVYVGVHITTNLNDNYFGSGKALSLAIKKYGKENFVKEILEYFNTAEEMFRRESQIVTEEFVNRKDTYNLKIGGEGGFDYINRTNKNIRPGYKHSPETIEKIKKAVVQSNTLQKRKQHSEWMLSNPYSVETKKKIAEAVSKALSGKPKTNEHKKKISEALKGKILSDDEVNRRRKVMSQIRLLKPSIVSDETRRKLSAANKNAWDSGKRKKPYRDWNSIQIDFDNGMKRKDIYHKYNITRNIFYSALKNGIIKNKRD